MEIPHVSCALNDNSNLITPYWEIDSGVDGPALLTTACQHGNELNGCVAVRDFMKAIDGKLRKGKVFGVPFANRLALRTQRAHHDLGPEQPYIESKRNMQMLWPGRKDGDDVERIAAALWEAVVKPATHIVDIHCYPKFAAPLIQIHRSPETDELADVTGFPFKRYIPEGDDWEGSIRLQGEKAGKIVIGVELSGQFELHPKEIARGARMLMNVAKHIGILDGALEGAENPPLLIEQRSLVKADRDGLFVNRPINFGDHVRMGETLGYIIDDATLEETPVVAPVDGHVLRFIGRDNCDVTLTDHHQHVREGDVIAHILREN